MSRCLGVDGTTARASRSAAGGGKAGPPAGPGRVLRRAAPRRGIEKRGGEAVIPAQKSWAEQRAVDEQLYRERNLCERFWTQDKQFRRVATQYEKKAANHLAFVRLAALVVMLK